MESCHYCCISACDNRWPHRRIQPKNWAVVRIPWTGYRYSTAVDGRIERQRHGHIHNKATTNWLNILLKFMCPGHVHNVPTSCIFFLPSSSCNDMAIASLISLASMSTSSLQARRVIASSINLHSAKCKTVMWTCTAMSSHTIQINKRRSTYNNVIPIAMHVHVLTCCFGWSHYMNTWMLVRLHVTLYLGVVEMRCRTIEKTNLNQWTWRGWVHDDRWSVLVLLYLHVYIISSRFIIS